MRASAPCQPELVQPQSLSLRTEAPSRPAESLSGLIERVTFFNEENGWAVLKVKAKGHRDLVTVVGSLPSVSAGEWLTAEGSWVQDREFGLLFRAVMLASIFRSALPTATAQPGLHGRYAGQETGGWPAEGVGNSGEEQPDGESVFRVAGPAVRKRLGWPDL